MKRSYLLHFSCAFLCSSTEVFAAACCGGGFAAPSLIVGDDKAQVTTSYTYSQSIADVGADGLWHKHDLAEASETFKLEAAHIFYDRWQAGISVPVVRRTKASSQSSGFGDINSTIGYEYLPDWDYNPWRPKGLGFLQLTLPSGRSSDEADAPYQLDSRGRGFWALGVGTILTKVISKWDVFASLDVHRSFAKNYANSQAQETLKPGYGGDLGLGAGYNLAALRLGGSLMWTYEDPIHVTGTATSDGAVQRYATFTLSAGYLLQNEWAASLTYADQTLFGNPVNAPGLGRALTVFVQKRWLR